MFRFLCVFQGGFWKIKGTAKGPRVLFAICFSNSQDKVCPQLYAWHRRSQGAVSLRDVG
jgi:hypothetical protein